MNPALLLAAGLCFAIAILHIGIMIAGPTAYTYFGAADLGRLETTGSSLPDAMTAILVVVFAVGGYYAMAAARRSLRQPPFLMFVLAAASLAFTVRGAAFGPELLALVRGSSTAPARYAVFSLVSLITGLAFAVGTWRAFQANRALKPRPGSSPA